MKTVLLAALIAFNQVSKPPQSDNEKQGPEINSQQEVADSMQSVFADAARSQAESAAVQAKAAAHQTWMAGAGLMATLVLLVLTVLTLVHSRDAVQRTQAAAVMVDRIAKIPEDRDWGPDTKVYFVYKNYAPTIATRVVAQTWGAIREAPERVPSAASELATASVGSQGELSVVMSKTLLDLCGSPELVAAVLDGHETLNLKTRMTYVDVFGKQHWSLFSAVYNADEKTVHVKEAASDRDQA